jgi:hypothetical protein
MTTENVTIAARELERYRRIEAAARELLEQMGGRRKATPTLQALANLRLALREGDVGARR